jgi:hypothetical protein
LAIATAHETPVYIPWLHIGILRAADFFVFEAPRGK